MSTAFKIENFLNNFFKKSLKDSDKDLYDSIKNEFIRQQNHIELIASENIVSKAVLEAQGSVLTNKYAEGYPGKRYYGGCEHVDLSELLAIDRAKKNIQMQICQCSTAFRRSSQWCCLSSFVETWRYNFRHEFKFRRPSYPRSKTSSIW